MLVDSIKEAWYRQQRALNCASRTYLLYLLTVLTYCTYLLTSSNVLSMVPHSRTYLPTYLLTYRQQRALHRAHHALRDLRWLVVGGQRSAVRWCRFLIPRPLG